MVILGPITAHIVSKLRNNERMTCDVVTMLTFGCNHVLTRNHYDTGNAECINASLVSRVTMRNGHSIKNYRFDALWRHSESENIFNFYISMVQCMQNYSLRPTVYLPLSCYFYNYRVGFEYDEWF